MKLLTLRSLFLSVLLLTSLVFFGTTTNAQEPPKEPIVVASGWGIDASTNPCVTGLCPAEAAGYPVYVPQLGTSMYLNYLIIRNTIMQAQAETGAEKVHLVGYSAGGVASLGAAKWFTANVRTWIGVDAPMYGTVPACLWGADICYASAYMLSLVTGPMTPGAPRYVQIVNTHETGARKAPFNGALPIIPGLDCLVTVDVPHSSIGSEEMSVLVGEILEGGCP